MPGRNEPCPCGSGKKYKKCCGKGQMAAHLQIVETELLAVNEEFLKKGLRPETVTRIEETIERWLGELRGVFPDGFIEQAAFDAYAFLDQPKDWLAFLDRQLKRHPRREVAEVLQAWKQPILLLAKAERSADGRLAVRDERSGRLYLAPSESPELAGSWMFGVALPYPASGEDSVLFRPGTLYLKEDTPSSFIAALQERMQTENLLGLLKLVGLAEPVDDVADLTPFAQEVLEKVDQYMGPFAEESGISSFTKELLRRVKINAKKPEAVAAGIIQAGADIGIVQHLLNQKQLASRFGVSVMTMLKYRDIAADFIVRMMEEPEDLDELNPLDETADGGADRILQVKVKLMRTSPPVWRRLHVDSEMSFADFHDVLQAAFEWDHDHLHEFRVTRTDGVANQNTLIAMDDEGLDLPFFAASMMEQLDETEERLSDWFVKTKDRVVYTYDFGADWEHEIVLEKRLRAEKGASYPLCVKAKGEAPGEYGFEPEDEEWEADPDDMTEIVNDLLELVKADLVPERPDPFGEVDDLWRRLLSDMAELRKLEPWNRLHDDQVFAVEDPASGKPLFVSVLGAAGEEFGLAVYIGDEGYDSLRAIMGGKVPLEEIVFSQRSLLASFSDRDELEADDLMLIKDAGLSFRGKKQWPLFRSFVPGYYPWSIDETEARILIQVIGQTKAVLNSVEQGLEIPPAENGRSFFGRRLDEKGGWQDGRFIIDVPEDPNKREGAELLVPEIEAAKMKKTLKSEGEVEYGLFFINQPVQDEPGQRPYFPAAAVALDAASGLVLHQHLGSRASKAEIVQQGLLNFIRDSGNIPKKIAVTAETERLLRPLAKLLAVKVEVKRRLPELERLKQSMGRM